MEGPDAHHRLPLVTLGRQVASRSTANSGQWSRQQGMTYRLARYLRRIGSGSSCGAEQGVCEQLVRACLRTCRRSVRTYLDLPGRSAACR